MTLRHDDLARLLNELAALSLEEPESGVAKMLGKVDRDDKLWKLQLAKPFLFFFGKFRSMTNCCQAKELLHSSVSSIIYASPQFHVSVHGVLTHAVTAGCFLRFEELLFWAFYDDSGHSVFFTGSILLVQLDA